MARTELIRTKLGPPLVNTRWVARDEQVHHLDLALERALTVLAAPAGFGKTSLLAQWRNALARRGIPSAWVSLDRDDDLALFGAYVLTALADAYQGLGQRARALVRNDHLAPAKSVVAVLVNEIAEARHPVVLILDDLDRVDSPAVPEALARILRHAPANLHIVAAGRGDLPVPISALESQNRVLRIEADGLRFSVADTERFLVDVAGLRLANGDADRLWRATEGWVAGLQLAAIVARESGRMTTASQGLKGAAAGIARYLTENVLALMPAELADLALQVSILDRVSPALAEAVTGNRHAPALLGELEARNLFLLPLDEGRNWYRFHALFADYLRGRLMRERPAEVAELHRRASRWLAGQSLWLEAVRHALAAGDEAAAAEWVEQCAMALIERSDLRTLQTWLGRLPPAAIRGRVRLRLAQVWCDTLSLRPREAVAGLQAIEADLANGTLEAPDTEALRREVLAVQALTAGLTDDSTAALRLAETVLALSPAEGSWVQRIAETALGFGASYAGGIGQALAAPTSSSEREPAYAAVYRESMVGLSALVAGRLLEAEPFLDHALRVAEARAGVDSAAAALPAGYLSAVLYEWNETPQAEAVQRQRFPISLETAPNGSMTRFALTAARLADLAGDTAEALRRLDAARVVARDRNWLRALAACEGEKVRLLVRDRDLPSATRLLQALARRLPPGSPPSPPRILCRNPRLLQLRRGPPAHRPGRSGRGGRPPGSPALLPGPPRSGLLRHPGPDPPRHCPLPGRCPGSGPGRPHRSLELRPGQWPRPQLSRRRAGGRRLARHPPRGTRPPWLGPRLVSGGPPRRRRPNPRSPRRPAERAGARHPRSSRPGPFEQGDRPGPAPRPRNGEVAPEEHLRQAPGHLPPPGRPLGPQPRHHHPERRPPGLTPPFGGLAGDRP